MIQKIFLGGLLWLLPLVATSQNWTSWLEADVQGSGQDVIFLPGYGSTAAVWQDVVKALEDSFRCHSLTLRQFTSEVPHRSHLLEGTLNALAEYARTETQAPPILVGHSIGGFLSLSLVADHPDLFSAMVSVDALPYLAGVYSQSPTPMVPDSAAQQYLAMDSAHFHQQVKWTCATMISDPQQAEEVASWALKADRYAWGYLFAEFFNTDLRPRMKDIEVPSLMMVASGMGEEATMGVWREQYKEVSKSSFAYFGKARHFIMLDAPEQFIQTLTPFLRTHTSQSLESHVYSH